jgi:prephenate dehydrogenase
VKITVLGVGLIGGSIGLAARARTDAEVCGYDPDLQTLRAALDIGAIDEQATDIATAVAGAQVVFAAAPVGELAQTVSQALAHASADCVISDVGSTKLALDSARADPRFVGGHPLAGAEHGGVGNASESLFDGALWYLTSTTATDLALLGRLQELIERLGAQPREVDPDAHDRLMASVSHLPHVLANVLAAQALGAFEQEGTAPVLNPSLRDATRVAGANTAIWTDIYLANGSALIDAIEEIVERLGYVRRLLARKDAAEIAAWNEHARCARGALMGETLPARPDAEGRRDPSTAHDADHA